MKKFFAISVIAASLFVFAPYNSAFAGNIEMIYWGAKNCPPCKSWEKLHKENVKSALRSNGVNYVEVMKPRIKDKFSNMHSDNKMVRSIMLAGAPTNIPHYTYMKDGERLFDVLGFIKTWKSEHDKIMKALLN